MICIVRQRMGDLDYIKLHMMEYCYIFLVFLLICGLALPTASAEEKEHAFNQAVGMVVQTR